jgi:hypothetical protein
MLKKKFLPSFQKIIELFTQKFVFKLSKIWALNPGSEIRDPEKTYFGSQIRVQGLKRHLIPDINTVPYCLMTKFDTQLRRSIRVNCAASIFLHCKGTLSQQEHWSAFSESQLLSQPHLDEFVLIWISHQITVCLVYHHTHFNLLQTLSFFWSSSSTLSDIIFQKLEL